MLVTVPMFSVFVVVDSYLKENQLVSTVSVDVTLSGNVSVSTSAAVFHFKNMSHV